MRHKISKDYKSIIFLITFIIINNNLFFYHRDACISTNICIKYDLQTFYDSSEMTVIFGIF